MNIIKTGILGLAAVICAMTVKEQKPQFAALVSLAAGILISYNAVFRLKTISQLFENLTEYTAIRSSWFLILMKIVGISYVSEFLSEICKDAGYHAIAGQIEIFGKVAILTVSTPVILALFQTVTEFLA